MHISRLVLRDFRSYGYREIEPDAALTVLVGPNAIGKTNIIEAIQLVATGQSFRNPRWDEVIKWGAGSASVSMAASGENPPVSVDLQIDATGKRAWSVQGVVKRRAIDATRFVPIVLFTPNDLLLVKGPAEQRRTLVDELGQQLSVTYGALRRDYQRVVRQRNALLKDEGTAAALEPWDVQLVGLGAKLHAHRRRLLQRVRVVAAPIYEHMAAGEVLDIRMVDRCGLGTDDPSHDITAEEVSSALQRELKRRRAEERARKVSLVGPHRDDITFSISGRDARTYASQGQQRTLALAWKWAEVAVIGEVLRRTPVLLLDDVMSELDETRRRALTDLVQREVQTFVTTTTIGYFDPALLKRAQVVTLSGGA